MLRRRCIATLVVAFVGTALATPVGAATEAKKKLKTLRVLVTNDDGFAAEGLDAIVEALRALPKVKVSVVAPAEDKTGHGDTTSTEPVTATENTTASGYPAMAVDGFPADTVNYALDELGLKVDLVVSGINHGPNLGAVAYESGTVGAAMTAVRRGIPAVALSQGRGAPFDFPDSVEVGIAWVKSHRKALARAAAEPPTFVVSFNVPSCPVGEPRGVLELPLAPRTDPLPAGSDCESTLEDPTTDQEAYANGFSTVADVVPPS